MANKLKRNRVENLIKSIEQFKSKNEREFFQNELKKLNNESDAFSFLLEILQNEQNTLEIKRTAVVLMADVAEKKHGNKLVNLFAAENDKLNFWDYHHAVVQIGSKRVMSKLLQLLPLTEDWEKREAIVYMLGWGMTYDKKSDEKRIKPLINILTDKSEHEKVRGQAAESLGIIESYYETKHSFDALVEGLSDESLEVRFWCCYGLGQIGDEEAIPHLERLVDDTAVKPFWWSVGKEAQDMINSIRKAQKWRQEWQDEF